MTVNYICNGFDKDFYNFEAVVVPVVEGRSKRKQGVYVLHDYSLVDFCNEFNEIMQELPESTFKTDEVTTVRS